MQYYLFGTGGGVLDVLQSTVGLDVEAALAATDATLGDLQAAVDAQPALAPVAADVDAVGALFANVSASVDALEVALAYATFHPVGGRASRAPRGVLARLLQLVHHL